MSFHYPFAAIVGQAQLKRALLLCAINPGLGGVLVRGDKGTAKSTASRALAAVLPPIARVKGCAFNCLPGAAYVHCEACQAHDAQPAPTPVPFITLPLGATEDRVLGSLDFERALKDAKKAFQPGLLAAAHRGILYIDEVNLLADHLVDVLLDVAAMGTNTIEREGLSISHPARVTMIGTMNLEEGDLRPQLLDRFALMVDVEAPKDSAIRSEVVRRRLAFEADPQLFCENWHTETVGLQAQLLAAQQLLPQVILSDSLLDFISRLCCEFGVASLRADIVMNKAARALAALEGRRIVTAEDVRDAAELVLPHRRRRQPFEQAGLDSEKLQQLMHEMQSEPKPENPEVAEPPELEDNAADEDKQGSDATAEQVFDATRPAGVGSIVLESRAAVDPSGRRSTGIGIHRGQYMQSIQNDAPSHIAVDATIRHAIFRNPSEFQVTRADLHEKVRVGKNACLILLVVDASGSMAARRRMELVKGTVLGLLEDAYQRRDQVAVIAFRGTQSELMLSPTRHVEQAQLSLQELPTGGRTPLAHALQTATEVLARNARSESLTPLLAVLSDGKANVALSEGGDPWQQSLAIAAKLAEQGIPALVLDTEQGFVKMGRARELADALRAEHLPLDGFTSDDLIMTIRERLRR
jgi:magnesium chelatase subunit D